MPKSTTPKSTSGPRLIRTRKPGTTAATPLTEVTATAQSLLTHDVIAARAYELFLGDGAAHGHDLEHWLRAEHELRQRMAVTES